MVLVVCPCGIEFSVPQHRIDNGRGKYCSKKCMYQYHTRRSGLKYNIKKQNPTWFKLGHKVPSGEQHPGWKGDDIRYEELHRWVRRKLGKPTQCLHCNTVEGKIEWANKSHEYKRDLEDWLPLCRFCHRKYDSGENRGKAVAKYGRKQVNCK